MGRRVPAGMTFALKLKSFCLPILGLLQFFLSLTILGFFSVFVCGDYLMFFVAFLRFLSRFYLVILFGDF